jgi:hypothetical protein
LFSNLKSEVRKPPFGWGQSLICELFGFLHGNAMLERRRSPAASDEEGKQKKSGITVTVY